MRTDWGERLFFHALAAMLFAAICAWCAAALYTRLEGADAPLPSAAPSAAPVGGRLRGVLLRREQAVEAAAFPDTPGGARLSARDTGGESALFFPDSDGWSFLSPEDSERLTPERLEALLSSDAREQPGSARLVYGFEQLCAALFEGPAPPAPGPCRVRLEGFRDTLDARLLSVTTDALGRVTLIIRLVDFPQELYNVRFVAGEVLG